MTEGDHINELYLLVAGGAVIESSQMTVQTEHVILEVDSMASVHGGVQSEVLPGDVFGEMAFFTEIPTLKVTENPPCCAVPQQMQ